MATLSGRSGSSASPSFGGVYRGMVASASDPMNQGRVQIYVPSLGLGNLWAPCCRAPGGTRTAPAVGAGCIVAFEGGNPSYPVVLGLL